LDLESCSRPFAYDDTYPERRGHFDPLIGAQKVETLKHWLSQGGLQLDRHVVCEIGFGSGFCLRYLQDNARNAFGVEQIPANLAHALTLGVRETNLYGFHERPEVLPEAISLWLFQDSFEHILDIRRFLQWVLRNSSRDALLLVVAPDAGSLSRKLLGRFWPHKLADHQFHWSRVGIRELFEGIGFSPLLEIQPAKRVSETVVLNHLGVKFGPRLRLVLRSLFPKFTVWFNVGEFGLLFQREHT